MGTIDRYRKKGGFLQLLQLIETCGPQKQEKFLSMVKSEDANWSEAIQKKMLSIEKILSWPDEIISEISENLQELTIAIALHRMPENCHQRFMRSFSFAKRRKIEDLFETNRPSDADISAAHVKIFIEVRKLILTGIIRADKVNPEIFVEDDIEEMLKRGEPLLASALSDTIPVKPGQQVEDELNPGFKDHRDGKNLNDLKDTMVIEQEELRSLRRKLISLYEENQNLKHEVQNLKAKIEHIKKIAA